MKKNAYAEQIKCFAILIFIIGNLFYFYEFLLQVAPNVMTGPLMHDFQTNATMLGVLSSSFFISYALFQIPSSLFLDRFGARYTLTIVSLLCAIGAVLFGVASNIFVASLARFIMGIAGASAFTAVLYLVIRWFPTFYFAMFAGITQLIGAIGAIGAEAPLTMMIHHSGWRQTMVHFGMAGCVIGLITFILLRDRPKTFIEIQEKKPNIFKMLSIVFKRPQTWVIFIYSFMIWAPITAFAALWGNPFLRIENHVSNLQAANMISTIWVGVAISSPLVGWISDKIKQRRLPLSLLALIGFSSFILLIFSPQLPIAIAYILLFLVGISAGGQTLIFAVVNDINTTETSTAAIGVNNMAVVGSGALLQPIIGRLLDWAWDGKMAHGIPLYTLHDFHIALFIMPMCLLIAWITSHYFLKETHCVHQAS